MLHRQGLFDVVVVASCGAVLVGDTLLLEGLLARSLDDTCLLGEHVLRVPRNSRQLLVHLPPLQVDVVDGMDVYVRLLGLARELAQTVREVLLLVEGQVLLVLEDDYAAVCN